MMKLFNKISSCILSVSILLSCITGINVSAAILESQKGFLNIEAEKTTYLSTNLSLVSDKIFSGKKGLAVGTQDKTIPPIDAVPDINLSFKADEAGLYTIWCRSTASQENSSGNSIFLSLDGGEYAYAAIPGNIDLPQWGSIGKITVAKVGNTAAIKIKIRQNNGIVFDRFIITSNASYKPDDVELGITTNTSTTTTKPQIATATTLTTKDGSLVLEAENLPYNKANFELAPGVDMSGGKGILVTNEDKTTPAKTAVADIDLSFNADKTGLYSVWVRSTNTSDSGGNSVFMSLNNGDYGYTVLKGEPTTFGWTMLGALSVNAGSVGSVRLIRRQKFSIVLDKFIITSNKLFVPQDKGGDPNVISEIKFPDNAFPTPSITPPTAHPRLMFTATDIPNIKANLTAEQNKSAYTAWQKSITTVVNSNLAAPSQAGGTNYNYYMLAAIEGLAFDYVINGNIENGKKAIEYMKNYSNTVVFDSSALVDRMKGPVIFTISEVYDWCYPLLSDTDKKAFVAFVEGISKDLEVGYPPSKSSAVSGHGGEQSLFHDLLGFGIATYNERPDIYNYCAGRILAQFVPARNFMYTSNTHNQGNAYGTGRGQWEIWSALLFKKMSGQDVFSSDQQYFPYGWLYSRRPDGQAFRMGDDFWEASGKGTYWDGWYPTLFGVANYYNDPYLKREYAREAPMMASFVSDGSLSPVTLLALNNTSLAGKPTTELPLSKYFAAPKGMMIARTGWNDGVKSPDAMAVMNISEHWGANHNHLDAGSFQLYYKGILASESGSYSDGYATSHDINYHKRGIAHNILTIYDPTENMTIWGGTISNDGGQVYPAGGAEPMTLETWKTPAYETGKVLGHEFGPDPIKPEYTYIKGDITKAYSDKVTGVLRSMVFLPLEDANHPATMIIMDKIDSTNADFKKSWLLHTQEEPIVNGNKTTVTRTQKGYNGKMVVETLLPKNPTIEKIGGEGKQFWIDGKNYGVKTPDATTSDSEGVGWGRVAISPSTASKTDYFLNVMSVSDNNASIADLQSTLIEGDTFVGAVISNRVAIFGKDANRMDTEIKFTIPGTGNYKVFVSSIKAGTWTTADGQKVVVTKDGGAAYFNANAGEVVLTYKNTTITKTKIKPVIDTTDNVGIRINKSFVYSDVKPVIVSGRTLIPLRVIFENLGATVTYDEATQTATATKDDTEIKIVKDSKTAYVRDEAKELDVPAMISDGRFVVPVRFVSESMGAKVTWDPYANLVDIIPGKITPKAPPMPEGYAKVIGTTATAESDINYATNSWDNNYETLWAAEGDQDITFELDKEYSVSAIEIMFNQNGGRTPIFEVQYSLDGATFNSIYEGLGDPKVEIYKFESFQFKKQINAKFIKFIAKGSDKSRWNGVREIRFKTK